jgi:hypothetical protein
MGLLVAVIATTTPSRPPVEPAAPAPAFEKIPVFLQSEVHDAVGALYVAKVRDAMQNSDTFVPVANPAGARFVVGFLTMDPNEAEPTTGGDRATAAAVTLQLRNDEGLNQLVYSWVLVARRTNLDSLASELVGAIDKEIHSFEQPTVRFID